LELSFKNLLFVVIFQKPLGKKVKLFMVARANA